MNCAFIITTFLRDDLLKQSVESVINHWQPGFRIIIVDQSDLTEEKKNWLSNHCVFKDSTKTEGTPFWLDKPIYYFQVPYDCGLSYCRNYGVKKAQELNIPVCILSADSIILDDNFKEINTIFPSLNDFDYIGLNLSNRNQESYWIGMLDMVKNQHFTLQKHPITNDYNIFGCDIIKNFFVAKTAILAQNQWDEDLILCEHEDYFWRVKQKGLKVGFTRRCSGTYIGEESKKNNGKYCYQRRKNFNESMKKLKSKYNFKGWVQYI